MLAVVPFSSLQDHYNLAVAEFHTYFAGSEPVLVHNCTPRMQRLENVAKALYPGKATRTELHHPIPKYLGGAARQRLVRVNAAYHQAITNEFRRLAPYGRSYTPAQARRIVNKVYRRFPIPWRRR